MPGAAIVLSDGLSCDHTRAPRPNHTVTAGRPFMFHYPGFGCLESSLLLPFVAICLELLRIVAHLQNCRDPLRSVSIRRELPPRRQYSGDSASRTPFAIPLVYERCCWPTTGFQKPETASRKGARKSRTPRPARSGLSGLKSGRHSTMARVFDPSANGWLTMPYNGFHSWPSELRQPQPPERIGVAEDAGRMPPGSFPARKSGIGTEP